MPHVHARTRVAPKTAARAACPTHISCDNRHTHTHNTHTHTLPLQMLAAGRSTFRNTATTTATRSCCLLRRHRRFAAMAASAAVLAAGSPEPSWGPSVDRPTLITTATCPYAQRTWIALHARGVAVDSEVLVDLQSKPEWFFTHNPYGRVPTLVWRAQQGEGAATESVYESLVCNELVAELPGTGPPLLPSEPAARAQVRLLVDQIAARFGGPFGKLMFSGGDGDAAAAAAAELADALRWCEQQKQRASGDAPFWGGSHLNLVDCAFAPFYLRLKVLERLVPGTALPRAELPLLEAWQAALLGHAAVRATMAAGPDGDDYFDHLAASYERFVAARKAAAK